MKKLITTTSLFALMLATPVLAQTSTMPSNEADKPAMEQPAHAAPDMKTDGANAASEMKRYNDADTAAEKSMVGTQVADPKRVESAAPTTSDTAMITGENWRASKLIGQPVRNASNETVGDINDFLLASDGSIEHVLVGVGGFLGLGEKVVALKFDDLTYTKGSNGSYMISTAATKKSLEAASEWKDDSKQ